MLKDSLLKKIANIQDVFKIKISVLARKSGIDEETLSRMLNGTTQDPGIYTVAKIADFLQCSIDELIKEDFSESYKEEVGLELAKSCVITVISLLRQQTQEVNFDKFLYILVEVYIYCLDKNLKTVDIKFATQFVTDATKSAK